MLTSQPFSLCSWSIGCIRLHRSENHDQPSLAYVRSNRSSPRLVRIVLRRQVDVRAPIRHLVRDDWLYGNYDFPQGSSLGPLCFNLYIAHLSSVIGSFGMQHHQYADVTQMYIAASKDDLKVNIDTLEKCTTAVHQWLLHNGLQLNPSKSEAILFTAARGRQFVDDAPSLQVSDAVIQPSATIKSLGVTLDRHLTFDQHVANVCKACYTRAAPCSSVPACWCCQNGRLQHCRLKARLLQLTVCRHDWLQL